MVDDADVFGRTASRWASDLTNIRPKVLFVFALRSPRVDAVFEYARIQGVYPTEFVMPNLTDQDIDALIDTLDRENRLGVLKGLPHNQRVKAFQRKAGRQLLVAMIEATSGERFDQKAVEEFSELSDTQRVLYSVICFIHAQRFSLDRNELLTAVNSHDNQTLNALEKMATRKLIVRDNRYSGYKSRHRVIAEKVVNSATFRSVAAPVIEGVCSALASHIDPNKPRTDRKWRRFIKFINHEFILLFCAVEDGRRIYQAVEGLLEWDYHYWLQRGALEVQEGDLMLATNYLGQARSLTEYDPIVEAEWAYLMMKKAAQSPWHTDAKCWFNEGCNLLKGLVASRGSSDPYPYHILGSQTISWCKSANMPQLERRSLLRDALDILEQGKARHPRRNELRQLHKDLKSEWLATAIR